VNTVNLLPEDVRPRQRGAGPRGGAYAVLGVLGILLAMAVGYAVTENQVNSRKSGVAKAKTQIERARVEKAMLASFGDFRRTKETRVSSVKQLASSRRDWERLMRELSYLLPSGTYVTEMTAATAGEAASGQADGAGAASDKNASPSLHLVGCAKRQDDVAVLMVRLRRLHGATDVQLSESARQGSDGGAASGPTGATPGAGEAASPAAGGCGPREFKFDVQVELSAPASDQAVGQPQAPDSRGGGS
jgi:Tfp pilus assembly protein PilN